MTWIKTLRADEDENAKKAIEAVRQLFPKEYATPAVDRDESQSITAAHSLLPDVLYHSFAAFAAMLSPELPLKRSQHEMIATVVSITNRCRH